MNIKEKLEKIKHHENDLLTVFVIVAVGLIAFGLGRLSVLSERKIPVTVESSRNQSVDGAAASLTSFANNVESGQLFVASKNSDKYHYPWCPGAQRIREANKIWFSTKAEAEKAGYSPASNCKGL
jgi:hypothetical protein